MHVKGTRTIRYSSDRPCSFRMSTRRDHLDLAQDHHLVHHARARRVQSQGHLHHALAHGGSSTHRTRLARSSESARARRCGLRPRSLSSCIPKPPSASSERCATRQAHALTTARLCSQEDAHRVRGSSRGHVRYPTLWLEEAAPVLRSIREHPISVLVTRRALGDEI